MKAFGLGRHLVPRSRLLADASDVTALLVSHGFIKPASSGAFDILPLGLKVQRKIEAIIHKHLADIGAIELAMTALVDPALWKKSQRLTSESESQFMFTEGKKRLLQPTGEEQVSWLMQGISSYRQLPLSIYQMTRKYRNELRPRGGLLRTREFTMKDLYTVDIDKEASMKAYHEIRDAYTKIFDEIGVPYVSVRADSGSMGGTYSHEYHYCSADGEDSLVHCKACESSFNTECIPTAKDLTKEQQAEISHTCLDCGSTNTEVWSGIEVGHTFHLGQKYSSAFGLKVTNKNENKVVPEMGSYGIGVSRLVSAIACTTRDKDGLNWPVNVAAAPVCVVSADPEVAASIAQQLNSNGIEALYDDQRASLGMAMKTARQAGWPYIVIAGKKYAQEGKLDIERRANDDLVTVQGEALVTTLNTLLKRS